MSHGFCGEGGDLFAPLPDKLLSHVLSFLPSREAVEASCLSRRWRHLWRSAPAVRVRGMGDDLVLFVNNLLICRDPSSVPPLRLFEIDADLTYCNCCHDCQNRVEVDPHVDLWVGHALSMLRAQALTARFDQQGGVPWKPQSPRPFASRHLTNIHLDTVYLKDGQLDFSCCPALLRLTLVRCSLHGSQLVSPSLERLAIVDCHTDFSEDPKEPEERMHASLSMPGLCSLEISRNYAKEQFIGMMPWLTEESISYTSDVW